MTYSVVAQRILLWALNFNEEERRDIENAQVLMAILLLIYGFIMHALREDF